MATSVGRINLGVGLDSGLLTTQLKAAVNAAVASVQQSLNQKPLKLKLEIDTATALTTAQAKLDQKRLRVGLDIDTAGAITAAQTALAGADLNVTAKVDLDTNISAAQLATIREVTPRLRALSRIGDINIRVRVNLDMTDAEIQRIRDLGPTLRGLSRLQDRAVRISIDLDLDEARLRNAIELLRQLRDQTVRINVNTSDVDRAESSVNRLNRGLGAIGGTSAGIAAAAAALAGITGAAGAALGAVGGLAAGILALGPAVAGIVGTLVVGFQGVGDAFSALGDMGSNAASEAASQADAVASASDALASANQAAEDSQRDLARAQKDSAKAAEAVGEAYRDAERDLAQYRFTVEDAQLSEREAALALRDAQKELAEAGLDPEERERALLRVERAELNLAKAQDERTTIEAEAAEAQRVGVEGSDKVIAAKEAQRSAEERVADAARASERAQDQVAKAAENLAKAQSASTPSADKFAEAMAKLSPNAQAFVLAAQQVKPALDGFKDAVQDSLFADLGDRLGPFVDRVLPAFQSGMVGVAGELNNAAQSAMTFLESERGIAGINAAFANTESLLRGLTGGTGELTQGLLDFTMRAGPEMEGLGRAIASVGEGVGRALSDVANSGQLERILQGFQGFLTGLGNGLDPLLGGLFTIAEKVLPTLGPLFETLGQTVEKISPALGDIGAVFVNSLSSILPPLGDLIGALATGLEPVLPVITSLFSTLVEALTPIIPTLGQIAVTVGTALIGAIEQLAPSLPPIATAFADLLTAVAPLVPMIAEQLTAALVAIAPALSDVFVALTPVIASLAEEMQPVIEQLAPVMAEVAGTIGIALADALRQIAPVLPELVRSFTDLVLAVVPLLPELVRMAAEILPPLVDILVQVTPAVVAITDALVWLIEQVILPLVIPSIQLMADQVKTSFDQIADVINFVIEDVFGNIEPALNRVGEFFATTVAAIVAKWAELKSGAAKPINFVIETVWNNGLLKAWGAVDNLLGGTLPDAQPLAPIPEHYTGGRISGPGGRDNVLMWGTADEHMLTVSDVEKLGGHNIVYAIRDMIQRGIPFTWDNGQLIQDLGRANLESYGARVAQAGLGNVPPEGLFDPILPRSALPGYYNGGEILPWMHQLKAGHDFARAQHRRPYKWAGPQFVNDSFDCSGFMGSIIAAILGGNPWQRYWATSSFAGYPAKGAQGLVKGLTDGVGMLVGITDDPGGPGGGHTAGELRGIPEMNIPAARVESGGAIGDVHYGEGTAVGSFASLYGLPIGANGFFQPSTGGGSYGPSVGEQSDFVTRTIEKIVKAVTDPVRETINSTIKPPPAVNAIPLAVLDGTEGAAIRFLGDTVSGLGAGLAGAWQRATDIGGDVLDFLNPFDSGGIATGKGFMPKNVIEPERVLDPFTTGLFETLVMSLRTIAGGASAGTPIVPEVALTPESAAAVGQAVTDSTAEVTGAVPGAPSFMEQTERAFTETGEVLSDTRSLLQRTETSAEAAAAEQHRQVMAALAEVAQKLTDEVLIPTLQAGLSAAFASAEADQAFTVLGRQVGQVAGDIISRAVQVAFASRPVTGGFASGGVLPGYTPGRDIHQFFSPTGGRLALSGGEAVMVPEWTRAVGGAAAVAAMNRKARGGTLAGAYAAGGVLALAAGGVMTSTPNVGSDGVNAIVAVLMGIAGIEVEVRNWVIGIAKDVRAFRGDFETYNAVTGEIISDTASLVERTETSREAEMAERDRIMREIMKGILKYLVTTVLIPIISAVLSTLITLATTAIGASIAGPIGAVIGAAVGAALGGLATIFTAGVSGLLMAGIDAAFDDGGLAKGIGFMPKNVIAPERVLEPRTTGNFEMLAQALNSLASGNVRTVQIGSMNISGSDPAGRTADNLLSLLNT